MHIVKRQGHKEKFDSRKIYGSVYYACRTTDMGKKECERVASAIEGEMKKWVDKKPVVSSDQISTEVAKRLKKHNKDAAFMYETHRDIS